MARVIPLQLITHGDQVARICNACRYCEGFCAVFPAMARRRTFSAQDLTFLAHLCHDCRECLYSCQYAPPHEFGVHVPQLMAAIRRESYAQFAWPAPLAALVPRQWLLFTLAAVVAPVVAWSLVAARATPAASGAPGSPSAAVAGTALWATHTGPGAFYQVVPHDALVGTFIGLSLFVLVAFSIGLVAYWRHTNDTSVPDGGIAASLAGLRDALTLRYLGSDGTGCAYPDEEASTTRRWFHHLTFYGFMLCFAATTVAAFYENVLGWQSPFGWTSLPVILGSVGGAGLLAGPAGLLWLKRAQPAEAIDAQQSAMDQSFLLLLLLTALTGFLVLACRDTTAMGTLLALHLGIVAGLFVTLPYGKFVHAIYRVAALIRDEREKRAASNVQRRRSNV